MTVFRKDQHSFGGGVFSEEAQHRSDLVERWSEAVAQADNMLLSPLGPSKKRPGLRIIAQPAVQEGAVLKRFVFSRFDKNLLVFRNNAVDVYRTDGALVTTVTAPWPENVLRQLGTTQFGDVMLAFNDAYQPQRISRLSATTWQLQPWTHPRNDDDVILQPQFKYALPDITLQIPATTQDFDIIAKKEPGSSDPAYPFNTAHVGDRWRFNDGQRLKEIRITTVPGTGAVEDPENPGWYDKAGGTQLGGQENLTGGDPTTDWTEQQWSNVRGWPKDGKFQQNRLACGGGARPITITYSTTRDIYEFDFGEGLDDDSVDFTLAAETLDPITRMIVLARRLVALTTVAEWATGDELITPSDPGPATFSAYGSEDVAPALLENGILFAGEDMETGGSAIFEGVYNELDGIAAQNISILAGDLIFRPLEIIVRKRLGRTQVNHAFVVDADGSVAVLNSERRQNLTGWSRLLAGGPNAKIISGVVVDGDLFFYVQRGSTYTIETLADDHRLDMSIKYTNATPQRNWDINPIYVGQTVQVIADDTWYETITVASTTITIQSAASAIEVGYAVPWTLKTLPPPMEQVPPDRRKQDELVADQAMVLLGASDGILIEGAPLPGRSAAEGPANPVKLLTGWHGRQGLQGKDGQITLSGDQPWPVEIRALMVWWQA